MCEDVTGGHHEHGAIEVEARVLTRRGFIGAGAAGLGAALLAACTRGTAPLVPVTTSVASSDTLPTTSTVAQQTVPTPAGSPSTTGARASTTTSTVASGGALAGFEEFADTVKVVRDGSWWLVESNGLPAHNMMVGITSWQQQVPVSQPYSGSNAWRIPVAPVPAGTPVSGRTSLYRGAIALAANGVPIFNALNNRGDDAFLFGELDQWGGHAGRADDYHYHVAPLHLSDTVGASRPIAVALDGYPIYGESEPDGSNVRGLDELNGHEHGSLGYHYHGTRTYPYVNGGLRGVVTVSGDQVEPQPRTNPFRPSLEPLRGATVTSFSSRAGGSYVLGYSMPTGQGEVAYSVTSAEVSFTFTQPDGTVTRERYARR